MISIVMVLILYLYIGELACIVYFMVTATSQFGRLTSHKHPNSNYEELAISTLNTWHTLPHTVHKLNEIMHAGTFQRNVKWQLYIII